MSQSVTPRGVDEQIAEWRAKGLGVSVTAAKPIPRDAESNAAVALATARRKVDRTPQAEVAYMLTLWCRAKGWPEPVQDFKFHPTRKWELDLCWPSCRLAVELQGGFYTRVGHSRIQSAENDYDKLDAARRLGWKVRLLTYPQVTAGKLVEWLEEEFEYIRTGTYS